MKGKVEAGMEFRYWSENVNISKFAASGLPAPAKSPLRAGLPGAASFTACLETEAGRNGRSFSRMTPPWTLLLGAPISAHSFPFPLWIKLQAGSSRSHGLSAFACQLEGDAQGLWNGNMERMLRKQLHLLTGVFSLLTKSLCSHSPGLATFPLMPCKKSSQNHCTVATPTWIASLAFQEPSGLRKDQMPGA